MAHFEVGDLLRQAMKQTVYSPERVFQDPNYTSKLRKADLATISSHLQTALGVKLSALTSGRTPLASLSSPLQHAKSGQHATCSPHSLPMLC